MIATLRIHEFRFNSIQGSVFITAGRLTPAKLLGKLAERISDRFDGSPTVLPMSEELPPHIPQIIFQSSDKQWQVEIAPGRVNYRWVQMHDEHTSSLGAFSKDFVSFMELFLSFDRTVVGRMAVVLGRYLVTEQPAVVLSRHFCKENWLRKGLTELEDFEMHSRRLAKFTTGYQVNSWIRFKSALLTIPKTNKRPIILTEQDVNTLAEESETRNYTISDILKFWELAEVEVDTRFRNLLET